MYVSILKIFKIKLFFVPFFNKLVEVCEMFCNISCNDKSHDHLFHVSRIFGLFEDVYMWVFLQEGEKFQDMHFLKN